MHRLGFSVLAAVVSLHAQVTIRQSGPHKVSVVVDGLPFTDFVYGDDVTKPYLDPLRSATGIIMTRRFPMQNVAGETTDHPEHRGVWFGHSDVNGFNFYANEKGQATPHPGTIAVRSIDRLQSGESSGLIEATLVWLDGSKRPILTERRNMVFYAGKPDRVIDFDFRLIPTVTVKFGDHRDGVFSIRLADGLQEPSPKLPPSPPRTGLMTSDKGCSREAECWGKTGDWMDYSGEIDGQKVGLTIFDHPQNPGHPTHWQARGYGLFAANIFGLREFTHGAIPDGSQIFEPQQTLHLRYRVVIHPGDAKSANIAAAYTAYARGER